MLAHILPRGGRSGGRRGSRCTARSNTRALFSYRRGRGLAVVVAVARNHFREHKHGVLDELVVGARSAGTCALAAAAAGALARIAAASWRREHWHRCTAR